MVSAPGRRQQVEYARRRGLSCRRACALLKVARSALNYQSKLAIKDAPALSRMSELAAQYPRYGYRQVRIFLARDGHRMGTDRAHRLWKRAGLQVPRRRPRRRIAASRPRPVPPTGPNHVWAYDFVFDTCATGQQIKCLTVVGEWTREALAIDVAGSIRSGRVIDVLPKLVTASPCRTPGTRVTEERPRSCRPRHRASGWRCRSAAPGAPALHRASQCR
jgi:putative transposase